MSNEIRHKRSNVSGSKPALSLLLGELAINTADGVLFTKKNAGSDVMVEFHGSETAHLYKHQTSVPNPGIGYVRFYPKADNSFYKRTSSGGEYVLWDSENHGHTSGLDADLLDGYHASSFALTAHNHSLDGLSNVVITSNTTNEILKWDGSNWVNNTLAEAGISAVGHSHTQFVLKTGDTMSGDLAIYKNSTQSSLDAYYYLGVQNAPTYATQTWFEIGSTNSLGTTGIRTIRTNNGTPTEYNIIKAYIGNTKSIFVGDSDFENMYLNGPAIAAIGDINHVLCYNSTGVKKIPIAEFNTGGGSGVSSFNDRTGDVTLSKADVEAVLTGNISSHTHNYQPVIGVADTQVLFMNGGAVIGTPGFNYKAVTSDFSVGAWASATGGNSYAFGGSATADAFSSIALGYLSYAGGEGAIAIGGAAEIYANYSVGIGHGAMCDNKNSIAIGRGAYATDEGDTVIGSSSYSANAYIYGKINFPSLSSNGILRITNGQVSVDTSSGFVTSVGLSMPSIFTVSGSPVTSSGTLTATLNSQTKNYVLAAPQFVNGVPTFRKLTADDMPDLSAMYDNYYSWSVKVNSGSAYQILKTGSATYFGAYSGVNFLAGPGISLTQSSIAGGTLGITITAGDGKFEETAVLPSNISTSSTTLTSIAGLGITLPKANIWYEVEVVLSVGVSAVTTGIRYGMIYTGTEGGTFEGQVIGSSTSNNYSRSSRLDGFTSTGATFITSSAMTNGQIFIKGLIHSGSTAGTLYPAHLKVTSGVAYVYAYSFMRVREI